jgi:hypothetical protein
MGSTNFLGMDSFMAAHDNNLLKLMSRFPNKYISTSLIVLLPLGIPLGTLY